MDQKVKELIYVGAAVTANCIPCIRIIYANARKAGLTRNEIKAAVEIGRMVRAGAAEKWDHEVESLLAVDTPPCSAGQKSACGC